MNKLTSEAAQRNREPIRAVLEKHVPKHGLMLEIGSGTGEHAVYMAQAFPFIAWQPTDIDPAALVSIELWRAESGLSNLLRPIALDVTSSPWPVAQADAIVAIDFAHAAPWETVVTLFERAAHVLATGGVLHLFGPVKFYGKYAAATIADLDWELQKRDPTMGIRDISALIRLATYHGFTAPRAVALPEHAHALSFKRDAMPPVTGRFQL